MNSHNSVVKQEGNWSSRLFQNFALNVLSYDP